MRLIFTYHEVRDAAEKGDVAFYAISPAQLSYQLATLTAQGGQSATLDELLTAPALPDGRYILTFDDGTADHYETVFPLLQKNKCRASFFIPTAKLDQPGYLTRAQLKELAAAGHAIGSHSHEHQRMDTLPDDEIRRQISRSQEIIVEVTGVKPLTFVPPGGYMNDRVQATAAELGIRVLRTMRWGYNQKLDLMALETIPINHYTDDAKFIRLLEPRGPSPLYAGKEILKRLLPMRGYERLRRLVFKLWN
jgi:peptidoglycan/xylan/chitin deacetylase (PgdA/CDA1 family)